MYAEDIIIVLFGNLYCDVKVLIVLFDTPVVFTHYSCAIYLLSVHLQEDFIVSHFWEKLAVSISLCVHVPCIY